MNRRRALRASSTAALVAVLLAACGSALPTPKPDAAPAVPPAATSVTQSGAILTDLGSVLDKADSALDAKLLPPRVAGPALTLRTAEYVRAKATKNAKKPTALPTSSQALVVPQTDGWPRTQLVVTEQPADLQAPRILALEQASPRDPYRLWGWGRMLPGVKMPATAAADIGSPVLAPDATGLVVTPEQALQQYADVLAKGKASAYADNFEPDEFRAAVEQARAQTAAAVKSAGSAHETYTVPGPPLVTLGTADGGAIVVGGLTTVSTETLSGKGGTIPITDPYYVALTGKKSASKSFVRTFTGVLVMFVPSAASGDKIQVLAAEDQVTAATAH
jgi:hypothetical protein